MTARIHPQALLERALLTDIRLARALEDFFTSKHLALPIDWEQPRAAQRRRVEAVPEPLRAAAAAFAEHLLANRERARKAGTHPRKHATVEARLNAVRDLAIFLVTERGKTDWATVDVADIEAFLHTRSSRRVFYLTGLRQFFGFAARTRRILIDPTRQLTAPQPWGFRSPTLTRERQRSLFRRWCTHPDVHPHEGWSVCSHCCTAPPPPRSNTSLTTRSTTPPAGFGSASGPMPHRWTPGLGPRCSAASPTARPYAAATPTC